MQIYKTTNLKNGKIYIGQNQTNKINYLGSGISLKLAIKKYGKKNFKKEIIDNAVTTQELNEKEIFWIKYYNSTDTTIGYNISEGGLGNENIGNYLNTMTNEEKEKHLNTFRRGLNYWKSKGFENIDDIENWISENWCGENHSHKKYKTDEEYNIWFKSTNIGENFIRSDLSGVERDEYFKMTMGGKNNPIFRGKSDDEIEIWLNENRRGENAPNAKYEYKIITPNGDVAFTKSLKTYCKENNLNYMVLYHLVDNPKRIPKKLDYRGYIITKKLKVKLIKK